MPEQLSSPEALLMACGAITQGPQPQQKHEPADETFTFEFPDTLKRSEADWLIPGLLPASGVGFLYGPTGTGKSFLAVDWACRLACGMPVFGHDAEEPMGTIYVAAEDADGIRTRILAWQMHHGRMGRFPLAVIPEAPRLNDTRSVASLRACILQAAAEMKRTTGVAAKIVIVDTLSSASPGMRGNEDAEATAQIAVLQQLAGDLGGVCLAIHHPGKDAGQGLRGSYVYQANTDYFFAMAPSSADNAVIMLTIGKMKRGPNGKAYACQLSAPIVVAEDKKGRPITSCVMLETAPPKERARPKRLPEQQEIFFKNIRGAMDTFGTRAVDPELGYETPMVKRRQLNEFLVKRELLDTQANAGGDAERDRATITNASRNRLQKALAALRHKGLLVFDQSRVALTKAGNAYDRQLAEG